MFYPDHTCGLGQVIQEGVSAVKRSNRDSLKRSNGHKSYLYRLVCAKLSIGKLRIRRGLFSGHGPSHPINAASENPRQKRLDKPLISASNEITHSPYTVPARPVLLSLVVIAAAYLGHSAGQQNRSDPEPESPSGTDPLAVGIGQFLSLVRTADTPTDTSLTPGSGEQIATLASNTRSSTIQKTVTREPVADPQKVTVQASSALQNENRQLQETVADLNAELLELEQELLSAELELLGQETSSSVETSGVMTTVPGPRIYDLTNTTAPVVFDPQTASMPSPTISSITQQQTEQYFLDNGQYNKPPQQTLLADSQSRTAKPADQQAWTNKAGSNLPILDDQKRAYDPDGNGIVIYDPSQHLNYTVDGYNAIPYQSSPYSETGYIANDYVDEQLFDDSERDTSLMGNRRSIVQQYQTLPPAPDQPYDYTHSSQ